MPRSLARFVGVAPRAPRLGLAALVALLACGSDDAPGGATPAPDGSAPPSADAGADPEAAAPADAAAPPAFRFEALGTRDVRSLDQDARVELVRAVRADGATSYLLVVPPLAGAAARPPVVVANEPYAGIDWSGEPTDARWAALGAGAHPDVDAPAYDGDDLIGYTPQTIQATVDGDAVWRANGLAVVHAYARFYAGGDVAGDVLDAAAAYHYLAGEAGRFDTTRLAGFGASWGGMMTLYGARGAPPAATPIVLAALTPLVDFADEWRWTHDDLPRQLTTRAPEAERFFSPYWRRAAPSMGAPPEVEGRGRAFTVAGLCPGLGAKVFAPHDDGDLLVPVRQTEALASTCGASIEPLYWRRAPIDWATAPLDHGLLGTEPVMPSIFTFAWAFVASALVPASAPQVITAGHEEALVVYLRTLRAAVAGGRDPGAALPRLRELASPRTSLFEATTGTFLPGGEVLARAVNAVWGSTYTAATLRTRLGTGLPEAPPP